jgi:hypothetical protein
MFYPVTISVAVAYDEARRQQLERDPVPQVAATLRPRLLKRMCVGAGDALISAGEWLQSRYEPAMIASPTARQSGC